VVAKTASEEFASMRFRLVTIALAASERAMAQTRPSIIPTPDERSYTVNPVDKGVERFRRTARWLIRMIQGFNLGI
jgi:hypothetical protein